MTKSSAFMVLILGLSALGFLGNVFFLLKRPRNSISEGAKTVVIYTYFTKIGDDSSCRSNFEFFLEKGVEESDKVDFVFILVANSLVPSRVVAVSGFKNVKFVQSQNYGSDLCNVYHAVTDLHLAEKYEHFFVLNCGARGPYAAGNWEKLFYVDKFVSLFTNSVRLVGASVSCEKSAASSSVHVQSWFIVYDKISLSVAMALWKHCPWKKWEDAISEGEVGVSAVLLKTGFKIAGMTREFNPFYSGKTCLNSRNPGTSYQDLNEQIFVKFGGELFRLGMIEPRTRIEVLKREGWIGQQSEGSHEDWLKEQIEKDASISCKEARFLYLVQYPDIKRAHLDPWLHFKYSGQKEGRTWRGVSCDSGKRL
jgi:hypothetical protein